MASAKTSLNIKKLHKSFFSFSFRNVVAVDLGATSTKIYSKNKDKLKTDDSVLSILKNTSKVLAFGHEAKKLYNRLPVNYTCETPIEKASFKKTKQIFLMLRYLISDVVSTFTLAKSAIFFVVNDKEKEQEDFKKNIQEISSKLHFKKIYIVDNIESASIGLNLKNEKEMPYVILNLGSSISSINILKNNKIIKQEILNFTGQNLDLAIIDFLAQTQSVHIGSFEAERIRKEIFDAQNLKKVKNTESYGKDLASGFHKKFSVNGESIWTACMPLLASFIQDVIKCLQEQDEEVMSSLLNEGIYITGGLSYSSSLSSFLKNNLNVLINNSNTPELDTINGMKIILNNFKEMKSICNIL